VEEWTCSCKIILPPTTRLSRLGQPRIISFSGRHDTPPPDSFGAKLVKSGFFLHSLDVKTALVQQDDAAWLLLHTGEDPERDLKEHDPDATTIFFAPVRITMMWNRHGTFHRVQAYLSKAFMNSILTTMGPLTELGGSRWFLTRLLPRRVPAAFRLLPKEPALQCWASL
jgi:hypothetical protein